MENDDDGDKDMNENSLSHSYLHFNGGSLKF